MLQSPETTTISSGDVEEYFSRYGPIQSVEREEDHFKVSYEDHRDAEDCRKEHNLSGSQSHVIVTDVEFTSIIPEPSIQTDSQEYFSEYITWSRSDHQTNPYEHFSKYGPILYMDHDIRKNEWRILYQDKRDAEDCAKRNPIFRREYTAVMFTAASIDEIISADIEDSD